MLGAGFACLENNHDSQNNVLDEKSFHESKEDMSPPTSREGVKMLQRFSAL